VHGHGGTASLTGRALARAALKPRPARRRRHHRVVRGDGAHRDDGAIPLRARIRQCVFELARLVAAERHARAVVALHPEIDAERRAQPIEPDERCGEGAERNAGHPREERTKLSQ
jgi:hypothetical protein